MSVSSVNLGVSPNQPAPKSATPQRADRQAALPSTTVQGTSATSDPVEESVKVSFGSSVALFNRVGVAAYNAVMNPQISTSMRTEA